jgi:small subunit ribosomal protein S6
VARPYETVLILDSSLDESQVEEKLARLKRAIDSGDDGAVSVTHWGKRKLAYPIGRKEQGLYVILRYETEPERLNELERLARIDEQVLRHLTVVDPVEPAEPAVHREGDDKDEEE